MKYLFDAYAKTDVGIIKKVNQDAYLMRSNDGGNGIFAVADGVGGLEHGEMASATAIKFVEDWWNLDYIGCNGIDEMIASLKKRVQQCNIKLATMPYKTATTLSVLLVQDGEYAIVHIGDSRIYTLSTFGLTQLTQDHSKQVVREVNGKKQVINALSEYVGYDERFECFITKGEIKKEQFFMLCSDGVYKKSTPKELYKIIKSSKKQTDMICRELIQNAKDRKESDNITALAVVVSAEK